MAGVLMAAAITALAVTTFAHSDQKAAAGSVVATAAAPSMASVPLSLPLDSGELVPFSFGYLVFENDPSHGVPGFGPAPSGARAPAR